MELFCCSNLMHSERQTPARIGVVSVDSIVNSLDDVVIAADVVVVLEVVDVAVVC